MSDGVDAAADASAFADAPVAEAAFGDSALADVADASAGEPQDATAEGLGGDASRGDTDAACPGASLMPNYCLSDTACGPYGRCAVPLGICPGGTCEYACCGIGGACCTTGFDCCSGVCEAGVCTALLNACTTDKDCASGAVCMSGTCWYPPGGSCTGSWQCSTSDCSGGQCACNAGAQFPAGPCRTTADCCLGVCAATDGGMQTCQPVGPGGVCHVDDDCGGFDICINGQCACLPGGAMAQNGAKSGCCSGTIHGPSTCWSAVHEGCTTAVVDCFGGQCVGGTCACVGPQGGCGVDADCCAGATKCTNGVCQ